MSTNLFILYHIFNDKFFPQNEVFEIGCKRGEYVGKRISVVQADDNNDKSKLKVTVSNIGIPVEKLRFCLEFSDDNYHSEFAMIEKYCYKEKSKDLDLYVDVGHFAIINIRGPIIIKFVYEDDRSKTHFLKKRFKSFDLKESIAFEESKGFEESRYNSSVHVKWPKLLIDPMAEMKECAGLDLIKGTSLFEKVLYYDGLDGKKLERKVHEIVVNDSNNCDDVSPKRSCVEYLFDLPIGYYARELQTADEEQSKLRKSPSKLIGGDAITLELIRFHKKRSRRVSRSEKCEFELLNADSPEKKPLYHPNQSSKEEVVTEDHYCCLEPIEIYEDETLVKTFIAVGKRNEIVIFELEGKSVKETDRDVNTDNKYQLKLFKSIKVDCYYVNTLCYNHVTKLLFTECHSFLHYLDFSKYAEDDFKKNLVLKRLYFRLHKYFETNKEGEKVPRYASVNVGTVRIKARCSTNMIINVDVDKIAFINEDRERCFVLQLEKLKESEIIGYCWIGHCCRCLFYSHEVKHENILFAGGRNFVKIVNWKDNEILTHIHVGYCSSLGFVNNYCYHMGLISNLEEEEVEGEGDDDDDDKKVECAFTLFCALNSGVVAVFEMNSIKNGVFGNKKRKVIRIVSPDTDKEGLSSLMLFSDTSVLSTVKVEDALYQTNWRDLFEICSCRPHYRFEVEENGDNMITGCGMDRCHFRCDTCKKFVSIHRNEDDTDDVDTSTVHKKIKIADYNFNFKKSPDNSEKGKPINKGIKSAKLVEIKKERGSTEKLILTLKHSGEVNLFFNKYK